MFAEIITIGDEILIGQIVDTNSAWMGRQLNDAGIRVKQVTSVSDEKGAILDALADAEKRADLVLITGGLGPTKDDITKYTLCEYFGSELVLNEAALENVRQIFARFKRPVLEVNLKQAEVPDNCQVLLNANGTAPGMWFEQNDTIFVSMPGVPFEMMGMMEEQVIPMLKQRGDVPAVIHETIMTAGIGESFLAEAISDIEDVLPPYIKLAYLPKLGSVRLRLSGVSDDEQGLRAELMNYKEQIAARVSEHVFAMEDIPFEEAILRKLTGRKETLVTAESCTGGYIAHLLTTVPGSSAAFLGGAVSYSYALKEIMLGVREETLAQSGAVSEETVREMAVGALENYQADYAIACSGIAGPGGGTADKPVGTVWIAVADKTEVMVRKFQFGNKRLQNIERTAMSSFYMLHKMLQSRVAR
jgi:nicotinamide-nucleotide amidase